MSDHDDHDHDDHDDHNDHNDHDDNHDDNHDDHNDHPDDDSNHDHSDSHDHSNLTFQDMVDERPSDDAVRRGLSEYVRRKRRRHRVLARDHDALWVRKDQAKLNDAEKQKFNDAIAALIAAPTTEENYLSFVAIHEEGDKYKMHSPHGDYYYVQDPVGTYRFLPWHRAYLLRFDERLREIDSSVTVPYWRWTDDFPSWVTHHDMPAGASVSKSPRAVGAAGGKPDSVLKFMTESHLQIPAGGPGINDFVRFSFALETGFTTDTDPIPSHNHLHLWIGGNMKSLGHSPVDPIFWLLHAEVDRLWHIWQTSHPTIHPELGGDDRMMQPHGLLYDELTSIHDLGYTYDDVKGYT